MNNKRVWTTKDGVDIPVRKMTDTHILNTFRMLYRKGDTSFDYECIRQETARRRLRPIKSGFIAEVDVFNRKSRIEAYNDEQQIWNEMLSGDGYKDFI